MISDDLALRREDELAALFRLTDSLYRSRDSADIYAASLDAITTTMNTPRASILLFDANGVMKFVAKRGLSTEYISRVEGHSPWHVAQTEAEPIFVSDIKDTNEPEHIKAAVKKEGICGLAFLPLLSQGVVIGKFMTYYSTPTNSSTQKLKLHRQLPSNSVLPLSGSELKLQRKKLLMT